MKKGSPGPKIHKTFVATQRGFRVCTVNAFEVRDLTQGDEEFTYFATHGDFPRLIPEREIWIDERLFEVEGIFYLANALTMLAEMEKGRSADRAEVVGLAAERSLRERLIGVKFRGGRPHRRVPVKVYVRRYLTLPDVKGPVEVRQVDGCLVRSLYKTDYTEGGHGYVYPWVPKGEIWVENDLDPAELPFVVAHEYTELRLMRDEGLGYERAHAISAGVEFQLREGGGALPSLAPKGKKFREGDVPGLTSPAFFEYVLKHHLRGK